MWEVVAALIGGAILIAVNAFTVSYHIGKLEGGMRAELNAHDDRISKLETKVFEL